MYLPNKKVFTANIVIGASIAFFIYFLKVSSLLVYSIAYVIKFLFAVHVTLTNNRFYYAPSTANFLCDAVTIIFSAYIWTYFRSTRNKLIGNVVLTAALVPLSLFVFKGYGIIVTSPLIACGIILNIGLDAVLDRRSKLSRLKILNEKQEAEFSILGHLNHNVKPNIQIAKSPISAVSQFLGEKRLLDEVLAKRLDGSDETVGEALQKAVMSLDQISDILDSTRKLVTQQIRREDFRECSVRRVFEREIIPLYDRSLTIVVEGGEELEARIHKESFVEAMNNIIRNAEMHAFPDRRTDATLTFGISENRKSLIIDYTNNGKPFPANLTAKDFLSFGKKGKESLGEGLGGAWIGKVIEAHNGTFEIVRDDNPVHFRITLPKRGV